MVFFADFVDISALPIHTLTLIEYHFPYQE